MFSRTYYPSVAGSVVVPSTPAVVPTTAGYATSSYGYGGYGGYGAYPAAPMSAPVMVSSFPRPAPIVVPTTPHYGYAAPMTSYYGGAMAPTVVVSGRSHKWRRSRRHHHSRFFDF